MRTERGRRVQKESEALLHFAIGELLLMLYCVE